ncbi:transcriptional regulator NagR [Amycolatopsis endophytica]|uniref:GntR family transcriptional regulator n=1 Tax=Amycolatopsis endophytica TaxID=860233 RepID=A0A853BAM0_9PSEU|nr:GntR family transcriptional regulator [Amycolatopsis endophytica]NYI92408.1 GntR family transcriptional regulator [Amycolatopsis endophytica]
MKRGPMYRVIYDDIVGQIRSGALAPHAQLPGEHDLARQYGVSRMTVRQALDVLGSDEFVVRKQGSGTFVSDLARHGRRFNRLRSFAAELAGADEPVGSRVIRSEVAEATAEVAERLGITEGDPTNRLTRVRTVGEKPAALQDAWIPYAVAPGLVREPLIEGSLYRTLTERYGVELQYADQALTAAILDAEQAGLLESEAGSPVLAGQRLTHSASGVVEFTYGWTLPGFPLLLRIDAE